MAMPMIGESDKIIVKQKTNVTPTLGTVCLQYHQKMSFSKICIMFHDNAQGNKHEQQ